MNIYNPKTYKRFPWNQKTVDLLIDLYAKKIEIFLDPARTQLPAWRWIVSEMKKNLNNPSRELLTLTRVSGRFISLKKKFKVLYFDTTKTDLQKQKIFPFYTKMCDLFTDYATKHLNSSYIHDGLSASDTDNYETVNQSVNESDVTNYVVQLLNEDDMDKTSLTILPYEDQENFSEHVSSVNYDTSENIQDYVVNSLKTTSPSETQKMRIKLSEIPSEAIYIHKEKMRIDPNTPFNRHINHSIILNQKSLLLHNSQAIPMKRKLLDDLEPRIKKKLNPIAHSSYRSLNKSQCSESEYLIEALDECELSDITMRQSKAIFHDTSTEVSRISSRESIGSINNMNSTYSQHKNKSELRLSPEHETLQSSLEVPPCPVFDDSSIELPRLGTKHSDTIRCVPREIIPKKLIGLDKSNNSLDSHLSLMNVNDDQPPKWFQNFLKQYNDDIKNINSKLDKLMGAKKSTSPVLIHPKVLRIKRDSI